VSASAYYAQHPEHGRCRVEQIGPGEYRLIPDNNPHFRLVRTREELLEELSQNRSITK
jgi:hypothetical protein